MNQETFYGRWVHTMKTILLRETYDNNIKEIFRLRQLSTGQTVFTASKFGECDSNIKSLQKPIFAHIRVTSKCNLNCPYCYANDNTNKEDMSDQLLLELVDICNQNDILCITWTGGEPLIRKGFCGCKSISLPLLLLIGSRDCAIDFKQHLFFFDSISSTESDIIHKEVFSIDHSFRNETGSIDSECIKCICDFIFEIVMKHIPFDGGRA